MSLDPALLEILACPECRGDVTECADSAWLRCGGCGRRYPVREGIPGMLLEESEKASEGQH